MSRPYGSMSSRVSVISAFRNWSDPMCRISTVSCGTVRARPTCRYAHLADELVRAASRISDGIATLILPAYRGGE